MTTPVLEHLTDLIEQVKFHNAETGFAVLQVKVRGLYDLVSVLGTLPEVTAGEWLDAEGRWTIDQQYGRQFRPVTLRTSPPNSLLMAQWPGRGQGAGGLWNSCRKGKDGVHY